MHLYFSQNLLVCLSVQLSVFIMRIGYQAWEFGCVRLNPFLSLSATNINCLLNGSLQSFGTTNVKVLLFHLELPCGWCPFAPTEKKRNTPNSITSTKISTPHPPWLTSLYQELRCKTSHSVVWRGRFGWNTGREKWQLVTELTFSLFSRNSHTYSFSLKQT